MKKLKFLVWACVLCLSFVCSPVRSWGDCNECDELEAMTTALGHIDEHTSEEALPIDDSGWPKYGGAEGDWVNVPSWWDTITGALGLSTYITGVVDSEAEQSNLTDWLNSNLNGVTDNTFVNVVKGSGITTDGGTATVPVSLSVGSFNLSFVGCETSLALVGIFWVSFCWLTGLIWFFV